MAGAIENRNLKLPHLHILPFIKKNFSAPFGVIFLSFLIGLGLVIATWHINFWPTDAEVYYFDPAVKLPSLKYISQIHAEMDQEKVRWLHGKEVLILGISWMQHLMNDFETLRPFMMLGTVSVCSAAVFIFLIAWRVWGQSVGLFCYFIFLTSFWPYLYVLFAKHQTLGLFFALLAILVFLYSTLMGWGILLYGLAGICLGLSLFSSTSAGLYFCFYAAAFIFSVLSSSAKIQGKIPWGRIALAAGLALIGFGLDLLWVNWPDVIKNIKGYAEYISISSSFSHFFYNQPQLQRWFPEEYVGDIRAGWIWVLKYFLLIMPVVFPVYVLGIIFLIFHNLRQKSSKITYMTIAFIALSLTPPLMAEKAHVAQYGGNYFPSFIGILFLIGYAAHVFIKQGYLANVRRRTRGILLGVLGLAALVQVLANGIIFFTDVYPTRMATAYLSRKIKQLGATSLSTYRGHRHRQNFILCLDPDLLKKLNFIPIRTIADPPVGLILVPPITGDSIYLAMVSDYSDFDKDVFLNELRKRGTLKNYAIASFKTLVNSPIWLHEEEILSYRYLILNDHFTRDQDAGRVWLLDAAKIRADLKKNAPRSEYVKLGMSGLRNIGTKTKVYGANGFIMRIKEPMNLKRIYALLYRIGQPQDFLQAYVYRIDPQQPVWVPAADQFYSQPLQARFVPQGTEKRPAVFEFALPLRLSPGLYQLRIYRHGPPDDDNYYQILNKNSAIILR